MADLRAPDSWEMADLDTSMGRLVVSAGKKGPGSASSSASSSASMHELADEAAPIPAAASSSAPAGRGGVSEEALSQVDQFLREALEKPRERLSILRMEQDVVKFIQDPTLQQLEFQALPTSYLRLAAHRVAQHYYLQSVAIPDNSLPDGSGSQIVLHKTSCECRLPPIRLADIPVSLPQEESNMVVKVAIKKRPQKHSENIKNANTHSSKTNYQKSVEERKEEYNKARARIFSSNSSSESIVRSEEEPNLPDSLEPCSFLPARSDEKSVVDGPEINFGRGLNDSSSCSSSSSRNKADKEPVVSRYRASNRVAIFRDREVDRKDPDYDRSYDRYIQRFDPGFGFNGGTYSTQALYSPAVNYNTEFPQLRSGHRPQVPMEHQPHPVPQHLRGPWTAVSAPSAVGYVPLEAMMVPINPTHVGVHSSSSVYMPSSQYSIPGRPGISFVQPNEQVQTFAQTHQLQPEASFGLARPR